MKHILWKKMITTTNYRKGRGNFHEYFLRIKYFDNKINIFVVTLGMGVRGSGKAYFLYTCENVDNCEQSLTF